MTMREKMARAMYEAIIAPAKYFSGADVPPEMCAWERWAPGFRARWLTAADAALDALLEPTEGMIEAAAEKVGLDRPEHHGYSDQHLAIVGMAAALRAAKDGK